MPVVTDQRERTEEAAPQLPERLTASIHARKLDWVTAQAISDHWQSRSACYGTWPQGVSLQLDISGGRGWISLIVNEIRPDCWGENLEPRIVVSDLKIPGEPIGPQFCTLLDKAIDTINSRQLRLQGEACAQQTAAPDLRPSGLGGASGV